MSRASLDAVVMRALARDRNTRYPTGQAMADDLEPILRETSAHPRMLADLLREAFATDVAKSQESLSSVTPEMLAKLTEDTVEPGTGTLPSSSGTKSRQWSRQRGFSMVGAAAVTATLAGLLLARGGGGSSHAEVRTPAPPAVTVPSIDPIPPGCWHAGRAGHPARAARCGAGGREPNRRGRARGGSAQVEAIASPSRSRQGRGAGDAGGSGRAGAFGRSIRGSTARSEAVSRAIAIGAVVAALLVAGPVAAATPEAERTARAHFQAGEAKFKAGAFDEALAEYQAGYDVLPLPGFLINVAQCQRRLGDLKTARATYQKFVLVAPDSPLLPQVRSMIAEIDGLLAKPEPEKPAASDGNAGTRSRSPR